METNKYYTPTIEEFHVGFEYEVFCLTHWEKRKVSFSQLFEEGIDWGEFRQRRVKYLDAEDIESLGFVKINNMFRLGNYNTFIDMSTGARIISFDDKLRTPNSDGTFKQYIIFKGFIKNKSELKKVLEMLNIKYD